MVHLADHALVVLAAGTAAVYARLMRGSLIETMGEDYIRTARAKGLPERRVSARACAPRSTRSSPCSARHRRAARQRRARRNVFNIPGIGRLNYTSITHSDFEVIQGTVLLASMFIIVANIVVDIVYAYLDPRVRYS